MQSAIITGASTGIGRETALVLARAGYGLTLVGRRVDVLDAVAAEARDAHDVEVQALALDVGGPEAGAAVVAAHLERFGRLDATVTAAGVFIESPVEELSSTVWDETFDINLRGTALLAIEAAQAMARDGGGRIVMISSVSGTASEKRALHYNAAKAAVVSVAKSMTVEFGTSGVTTNAIAPGWIATPQAQEWIDKVPEEDFWWINPLGRPGRAAEVAEVIRWLVCDAPEFLTGTTITVDGGQLAQSPPV